MARHQPASQPTSQPTSQPASQPASQPTNQLANQPASQPASQPANQPASQPASQPTSQPASQPASQPTRITVKTHSSLGNSRISRLMVDSSTPGIYEGNFSKQQEAGGKIVASSLTVYRGISERSEDGQEYPVGTLGTRGENNALHTIINRLFGCSFL
ncbi:hypothetical protein Pmani_022940 [Petrolisthes manimaculis]|uniref:Uncharacterized protein n=1 Tax=Petrolisthes manimaculis TaxID=1843537 RepID=A0AAE1PDC1_9EUCA|nr:hypothetical protein Pmani_022940 [Petrolisthes manimaculis]